MHKDTGMGDEERRSLGALELPEVGEWIEEESRPRLSLLRILMALLVIAGIAYGAYYGARTELAAATVKPGGTWFAPYVDVALTPTYPFQSVSADPARQSVLGFVVASSSHSCTPSWGGRYSLTQADQQLALASRIAEVRRQGAGVIVSFGGQAHTSLSVACSSVAKLASAYEAVVKHYGFHVLDFDIEGQALSDAQALRRRGRAIADLQQSAAAAGRHLAVWLTLPVEPDGLQANALAVVESVLMEGVHLAGIDVMAMDFAQVPATMSGMLSEVESALRSTHAQLEKLGLRYGLQLNSGEAWKHLGVTVMIGQNNVEGERFTLADARGLRAFAERHGLARVSMWSLNRDQQCGTAFARVGELSNSCSGTPEPDLGFTQIFGELKGSDNPTSNGTKALVKVQPDTNPANAPYPLWSPTVSYPAGYKVVDDGEIYEAKWYNSEEDPRAFSGSSSPWELLGPVVPTDHAPKLPKLPTGTYPSWSATVLYHAGQRVLYESLPYMAKWTNEGVSPETASTAGATSPWLPLYNIPGEPGPL